MAARKQKRMSAQVVEDEDYQLRYERVAGIDVAKGSAAVCLRLPPGPGKSRRTSRTWEVTARVPDIEALAAELKAAGVQKVSMESTSDYWRIWFVVLEAAGLDVQLVNSSQARNLPGRPKTGKADAAWIARLTEMGLLRPSFVPPRSRTSPGPARAAGRRATATATPAATPARPATAPPAPTHSWANGTAASAAAPAADGTKPASRSAAPSSVR